MTASVKPDNTAVTTGALENAPKLPGVLFLIRDAFIATWKLRVVVYGYTAWLLVPIIVLLFAQGIPSPIGNYLLTISNFLGTLLGLWVTAAIVVYVAVVVTMEEGEKIDYNALGRKAWEKVVPLFIVQVFTICAVVFGTILFVIPGLIIWVWTTFALEETLLSSRGVGAAFQRSRELIRGKFWAVFGRMFVANALLITVIVLVFSAYVLIGLQGSASLLIPTLQAWPSWLEVGFSLIALPFTPVAIIFHLMLYFGVKKSYIAPDPA